MLRVAHTITRLAGGPSYRTVMLAQHMNNEEVTSWVFYGSRDKWDPQNSSYLEDALPVPSVYIPQMKRNIYPHLDLIALWKMVRELRKFNPHVIHTHESKDGLLARMAGMILGTPAILRTYHGLVYYDNFFGPKTALIRPLFLNLERLTNHFTDRVVSIGASLEPHITDLFRLTVPKKVITIPNPFLLEPFLKTRKRYFLRQELNLPADAVILTVVANFQPPKDHPNVIDAFAHLMRLEPGTPWHLCLVGNGPLLDAIKAKVQAAGVSDRVHFLGYRSDTAAIYGSSHLTFLGSSTEGTPGVVVESLAAGTRVVATDVGATRDVIRSFGTLVPPRDSLALARGILQEMKTRRDMTAIRREISSIHDVTSVAEQTLALYRQILREKGKLP
ncbi:glycosyltransferase [Myxococcota bacterium]|nr:glycosyltransferase [Myxococcota bacterium]MBU1535204.1 glycosyltransferase [Myxococcota bacterium]